MPTITRRTVLSGLTNLQVAGTVACSPHMRASRMEISRAGAQFRQAVSLGDFTLSPDGRMAVFQFSHGPGAPSGLGLYEWRTDKVTRIPNPPGGQLSGASFSSDGKTLAAVLLTAGQRDLCGIVTIDRESLSVNRITEPLISPSYVVYPIFAPGDLSILYCEKRGPHPTSLKTVNVSTKKTQVVLGEKNGFFLVGRPSFTKTAEIYFGAIGPEAPNLLSEVGPDFRPGAEYNYSLQFGDLPQRLFPRSKSLPGRPEFSDFESLSASRNGEVVVALGLNLKTPKKPNGAYNWEVFQIHHLSRPEQLTDLQGYLGLSRVSYDGSTVCFGSRSDHHSPAELNILDIAKGVVIQTGLRRVIESDPRFFE